MCKPHAFLAGMHIAGYRCKNVVHQKKCQLNWENNNEPVFEATWYTLICLDNPNIAKYYLWSIGLNTVVPMYIYIQLHTHIYMYIYIYIYIHHYTSRGYERRIHLGPPD